MSTDVADDAAAPRRRRWPWAVGAIVAVLVVLAAGLALLVRESVEDSQRPIPEFPSLADDPDPSIEGTVAYLAADGCIHLVAAAGAPDEQVHCLPAEDPAKTGGKEVGPQLVWLPDGRLEITVFRMNPEFKGDPEQAPELLAGWQQLLDVRTGEVTDVPADEVPSEPNLTSEPLVDPDGRRIVVDADPSSGTVEVGLDDGTERTLLSAQGPSKYQYSMRAFWSPTWDWVVGADGRILVITTDDPSTTRVLVDEPGSGRSGGTTDQASFAVTDQDLLGG